MDVCSVSSLVVLLNFFLLIYIVAFCVSNILFQFCGLIPVIFCIVILLNLKLACDIFPVITVFIDLNLVMKNKTRKGYTISTLHYHCVTSLQHMQCTDSVMMPKTIDR